MPDAIILAGPNGAGKSTIFPALRNVSREEWTFEPVAIPGENFVNSDDIAREHNLSDMTAGRKTLEMLDRFVDEGRDLAFETTLSGIGRAYSRFFERLHAKRYRVYIAYVWLESAELSMLRVAQRAFTGKHYIPLAKILTRYGRSISNFVNLYSGFADVWVIIDNSRLDFRVAAWGGRFFGSPNTGFSENPHLFERFKATAPVPDDARPFPLCLAHRSGINPLTAVILEKIRRAIFTEIKRRPAEDYVAISQDGRIRFIKNETL